MPVRLKGYDWVRRYLPNVLREKVIGSTWHSLFGKDWDEQQWWRNASRYRQILRDVQRRQPTHWFAIDDDLDGSPEDDRAHVLGCSPLVDRVERRSDPGEAEDEAGGMAVNHNGLKDTIIVEWLDLDPDRLAAEVPVEMFSRPRSRRESDGGGVEIVKLPYVSWRAVEAYSERVCQAFAGYKGSYTTDLGGYAYAEDWQEFLQSLRKAREIASDPLWDAPRDGVVYRCWV